MLSKIKSGSKEYSFTYNDLGQRLKTNINDSILISNEYEYDEVYNITKIYLNDKLVNEYNYDKINQLISESDHLLKRKYQYVYDIEGNIVAKKEYDLNTDELLYTNNYEYNNSKWEDQLTKFNDEVITYDAIGNPLTIGNTSLTWKGRSISGT